MTAVVPSGAPAWARSAGHADYGGHVNKADFQGVSVVNPKTDVSAAQIARMAADMTAVVRTTAFCVLTGTMATDTGTPTFNAVRLMTGVYNGSAYSADSAPTGYPSGSCASLGVVDVTFASSYSDDYSVSAAFAPSFAMATAGTDSGVRCRATISGQSVRVTCVDQSGSAVGGKQFTLTVL